MSSLRHVHMCLFVEGTPPFWAIFNKSNTKKKPRFHVWGRFPGVPICLFVCRHLCLTLCWRVFCPLRLHTASAFFRAPKKLGPWRFTSFPSVATIPTMPLSQGMLKGISAERSETEAPRRRLLARSAQPFKSRRCGMRAAFLFANRERERCLMLAQRKEEEENRTRRRGCFFSGSDES